MVIHPLLNQKQMVNSTNNVGNSEFCYCCWQRRHLQAENYC